MADSSSQLTVRPLQYRDLETLQRLWSNGSDIDSVHGDELADSDDRQWIEQWYWPLKVLNWIPNPWQHSVCFYVAEQCNQPKGVIQVAPFNHSRSTWRIHRVQTTMGGSTTNGNLTLTSEIGSHLLRYCLEEILEARTWIADVNVNDKALLALYRQNGFQPLAQITRWAISPELLKTLAEREPALPNLLPVNNADARLLYQLDTVSMPPLLRQVFDRHIQDFQLSLLEGVIDRTHKFFDSKQYLSQYVFEPQRKAAIGQLQLTLSKDGSQPHKAKLTVHPAYTWLYPELLTHMSRLTQAYPSQVLSLKSADYQPEREEYLEQIQADRIEHNLLMSRSVWHKLREQRGLARERLQLSDMLQGLQPQHKPIPGRMIHQFDTSQPDPGTGQ